MARRKGNRKPLARAAAVADADGGREPGRFSARRKTEALLRLLRGEVPDLRFAGRLDEVKPPARMRFPAPAVPISQGPTRLA